MKHQIVLSDLHVPNESYSMNADDLTPADHGWILFNVTVSARTCSWPESGVQILDTLAIPAMPSYITLARNHYAEISLQFSMSIIRCTRILYLY